MSKFNAVFTLLGDFESKIQQSKPCARRDELLQMVIEMREIIEQIQADLSIGSSIDTTLQRVDTAIALVCWLKAAYDSLA